MGRRKVHSHEEVLIDIQQFSATSPWLATDHSQNAHLSRHVYRTDYFKTGSGSHDCLLTTLGTRCCARVDEFSLAQVYRKLCTVVHGLLKQPSSSCDNQHSLGLISCQKNGLIRLLLMNTTLLISLQPIKLLHTKDLFVHPSLSPLMWHTRSKKPDFKNKLQRALKEENQFGWWRNL